MGIVTIVPVVSGTQPTIWAAPRYGGLAVTTIGIVPYRKVDDPDKLRRLMDAVLMLEADIELPVLLRHLVEEARSLVNARYGALGVLDETRTGLEQFITVGLSDAEEKAIGARPAGHGRTRVVDQQPRDTPPS